MKTAGIDEAGRGPAVGPLVITGVMIESMKRKRLKDIGVKDSKLLAASKREILFDKIFEIADKIVFVEVSPEEIDLRHSAGTNLNKIEAVKFAEIIDELMPEVAIVDTPCKNTDNFKKILRGLLNHSCRLVCENYADLNHVEVAAASIISKVIRDRRIKEIEKNHNVIIGAGYPSDETTISFLEKSIYNRELKKHIRHSWYTCQKIREKKEQKKLGDWKND